jgi:hypothetical protein
MYHGGFERNFSRVTPGFSSFEGTDGKVHTLPPWPSSANGLCFGYMEKSGKKFCVVRVVYGADDIALKNEVVLDPGRHTGFGHRLGPEPTLVEDDAVALVLLEDIAKKNTDAATALLNVRARFKAAAGIK